MDALDLLRKAVRLLEKEKAIEEKRGDTMPSIEHMRTAISDAYPGDGWKYRCEHMHENQVIAIYRSLMKRGAFDSNTAFHQELKHRKFIEDSKMKAVIEAAKITGQELVIVTPDSGKGWVNFKDCTDGLSARFYIADEGVQLSMFDL